MGGDVGWFSGLNPHQVCVWLLGAALQGSCGRQVGCKELLGEFLRFGILAVTCLDLRAPLTLPCGVYCTSTQLQVFFLSFFIFFSSYPQLAGTASQASFVLLFAAVHGLFVIFAKVLAPVRCSSSLFLEERLIMAGFPSEHILRSVP